MQEREGPQEPATPESAWRSQDEQEGPNMQITTTTDELCAMARSQGEIERPGPLDGDRGRHRLSRGIPLQLVFYRSAMDQGGTGLDTGSPMLFLRDDATARPEANPSRRAMR